MHRKEFLRVTDISICIYFKYACVSPSPSDLKEIIHACSLGYTLLSQESLLINIR